MSYSLNFSTDICSHCKRGEDTYRSGCTYNLYKMFCLALGSKDSLRCLPAMPNEKAEKLLDKGIEDMEKRPEVYKALNPKNRWGNSIEALGVLRMLRSWYRKYPDGSLRVS